jgi:hypothetical protein
MTSTTLICEVIVGVVACLIGLRIYRFFHRHSLWKKGYAIPGTVVSAQRTGLKDNQRAKIQIRVRYVAKDGVTREIGYRAYFYAENIPQAGDAMTVRVSETNPGDAAVNARETKSVYGQ